VREFGLHGKEILRGAWDPHRRGENEGGEVFLLLNESSKNGKHDHRRKGGARRTLLRGPTRSLDIKWRPS